jgi:hypothetical protein
LAVVGCVGFPALTVIGCCELPEFIPPKFGLLPVAPIDGTLSGAFAGACMPGDVLLAEPIPAVRDAQIDAPIPFDAACELRDQLLSSAQESTDFGAVFLTSDVFEPSRGDDEKSDSRVVLVLPIDALRLLLLLLFELPSQAVAQLSEPDDGRSVENDDDDVVDEDGWPQLDDVLELGWLLRNESLANDGPLSIGVVLDGVKLLVTVVGIVGSSIGGAATDEPMLVQPLLI